MFGMLSDAGFHLERHNQVNIPVLQFQAMSRDKEILEVFNFQDFVNSLEATVYSQTFTAYKQVLLEYWREASSVTLILLMNPYTASNSSTAMRKQECIGEDDEQRKKIYYLPSFFYSSNLTVTPTFPISPVSL